MLSTIIVLVTGLNISYHLKDFPEYLNLTVENVSIVSNVTFLWHPQVCCAKQD